MRFSIHSVISMSLLWCLLSSCNAFYFSQPQPVDRKNVYVFPKAFRGHWGDLEDSNVETKKADRDTEFFVINKRALCYIQQKHEKIAKGAWPKRNEKGMLERSSFSENAFTSIHYDTLNDPVDTVDNYFLSGEFIYENENGVPGKPYRFIETEGGIVVQKSDTLFIDLGHNAFLRKLNKNFWVLNIHYSVFDNDAAGWWFITILQKEKHGRMTVWNCSTKTASLPAMFHEDRDRGDNYYFNSQWTASEMMRLLQEGYFEKESKLSRK